MAFEINANVSALDAIQRAFAASANNTANALTENYNPSRAVFRPTEAAGVAVDNKQRTKAAQQDDQDEGEAQPSRTDLAEERVNQMVYSATYKANLGVIKTQHQIAGALLDTVG